MGEKYAEHEHEKSDAGIRHTAGGHKNGAGGVGTAKALSAH